MTNEINTQKARTIFNIGNLKLTIQKRYIVALLMVMVVLFAYAKQDNIKHYLGWDKAFAENDTRFRVLVLPFKQLCDGKRDVGEVIKDRLEQLSQDDTLDIGVYYANIPFPTILRTILLPIICNITAPIL